MRRLLNYNTQNETDSRLLTQYSAEYKIKNERNRLHVSMKLKQNYIQVTRNYKTVYCSAFACYIDSSLNPIIDNQRTKDEIFTIKTSI